MAYREGSGINFHDPAVCDTCLLILVYQPSYRIVYKIYKYLFEIIIQAFGLALAGIRKLRCLFASTVPTGGTVLNERILL